MTKVNFTMANLVFHLHKALVTDAGYDLTQTIANVLFDLDTLAMKQGIPTIYSWRVPNPK